MITKNSQGRFYRRNLPHLQPIDGVFFITTRLFGSLPAKAIARLQDEHACKKLELKNKGVKGKELNLLLKSTYDLYFGKFDHLLDSAAAGPTWLEQPAIAQIVKDSLHHFDNERYKLVCYTIMPNHIHFIIYKLDRVLFRVMQSFKRYTGREANKALDRTGHSFWQGESFDRLIRHKEELAFRITYILNNPVKAGLTRHWREWPHNYIRPGFEKYIRRTDL